MVSLNIVGFQRSLAPKEMLLVNKKLNKMHRFQNQVQFRWEEKRNQTTW